MCFTGLILHRAVVSSLNSSLPILTVNACRTVVETGPRKGVINLEPLARTNGIPRYVTAFRFLGEMWNYSFNPCHDYDMPKENPHAGFADGCHSVSVCKHALEDKYYLYTLGIRSSAKFQTTVAAADNTTIVELVFQGIKSMRARSTVIKLVCDVTRTGVEDGLFSITDDSGRGAVKAELHHQCCCPGGCWYSGLGTSVEPNVTAELQTRGPSDQNQKKGDSLLLIIIGSSVAVLMLMTLVGGLCYIKRTHLQLYSKLPIKSSTPGASANKDFRDYEPNSLAKKKILPVLEDTMIQLSSLEMCQRLGGGIFADTHLARWKGDFPVAVKRLTLLVHEHQITPEAMKLMKNEVWFLSRQRHKNIVSILGLCLDGKLPSIIMEHIIGECLKDFIKVQGQLLTWPHRIRICTQVADGMAFLHSTKPPIIHRDLRCGNIFLSDNDVVKVADFGLIKLLQPVREECPQDDCCCRRTTSACPASVRWTAPELLALPRAQEKILPPTIETPESTRIEAKLTTRKASDTDPVITTACDVYSFAMVMWELPMCQNPFQGIALETDVQKIVQNGGRPETPPSADMMPQYKELMKNCWDQMPANRPPFKQICSRFKDLGTRSRTYQKQLENKHQQQKIQQQNFPV